jgi:Flp pilus assembly pilin Flp
MHEFERIGGEERGQTMAEYAVVMTVITLAIIATIGLLSTTITSLLNQVVPLL